MAETKEDSLISLEMSKKAVFSDVYTMKLPNFFTLPEYAVSPFEISSPSFKFAYSTWCFRFQGAEDLGTPHKCFSVYMLRLDSEIPRQDFFFKVTLLDADDKKYQEFYDEYYFDEDGQVDKMCSFVNDKPSYDRRETLTVIIHLLNQATIESEMDVDSVPPTTNRNAELLSRDFKDLFLNGKNTDLTLRVEDQEFRVHKAILMTRSEVFEAMLSHDMIEKNRGVIDIPDCNPQIMEQLLIYVYSGKVEIMNQDNVFGLYYAADKYNMTLLKEMCTEFMKKSLLPSIVCDVISLALRHNDTHLFEYATEYFVNHTSDIFPSLEWMSFMKLNLNIANELLIKASKKWDSAKS